MTLLESISSPQDLKALDPGELPLLAADIRDFLIQAVSRNGGHLGPNLGVVELTIALHRVFDSPADRIVFDTGHQAYVHKLLTGRQAGFAKLKHRGGVSGYPCQAESEHDIVENSHASTSLSYADGLAKAYEVRGETDRMVVAVIGDGALTGGMAWEALNNIAASKDRRLVIIVNDNGRSYQPTIGGIADHLAAVRVSQRYEQVLDYIKTSLSHTPLVGPPLFETLHGIKKGLKDVLQPQVLFEDLGLKYLGPVDGHDEQAVEHALGRARDFGAPVLVHVITRKGFGYPPAENDADDCLHQIGTFDPATGTPSPSSQRAWTKVFSEEMVAIGARRPDVVAITAAMLHPTGLAQFAQAYPDRVYDVGIAEQHAMTSAAGLAMGGLHPVVALYSTFLNRAFDQLLMDVALHKLPVTVVLDRAGVTGPDGRQPQRHVGRLDHAGRARPADRGAAGRGPRGGTAQRGGGDQRRPDRAALPEGNGRGRGRGRRRDGDDGRAERPGRGTRRGRAAGRGRADGDRLPADGAAAGRPRHRGHRASTRAGSSRWTSRWWRRRAAHRLVAVVEDNGRAGGFGDAVCRLLRDHDVDTPAKTFGLPQEFLDHGERAEILAEAGLTPQHLAIQITAAVARRTPALAPLQQA